MSTTMRPRVEKMEAAIAQVRWADMLLVSGDCKLSVEANKNKLNCEQFSQTVTNKPDESRWLLRFLLCNSCVRQ